MFHPSTSPRPPNPWNVSAPSHRRPPLMTTTQRKKWKRAAVIPRAASTLCAQEDFSRRARASRLLLLIQRLRPSAMKSFCVRGRAHPTNDVKQHHYQFGVPTERGTKEGKMQTNLPYNCPAIPLPLSQWANGTLRGLFPASTLEEMGLVPVWVETHGFAQGAVRAIRVFLIVQAETYSRR